MIQLIEQFFPELEEEKKDQLKLLNETFIQTNKNINLISRKEHDFFVERHLLHSLSIAKYFDFSPGTSVMDIGTGGGLPGIPLAVLFPECRFLMVDSIQKKINAVSHFIEVLNLKNSQAVCSRCESINQQFDFIVSRAVAPVSELIGWTGKCISKTNINSKKNGFIFLKGGDLENELANWKMSNYYPKYRYMETFRILDIFPLPFFETKKIIYIH